MTAPMTDVAQIIEDLERLAAKRDLIAEAEAERHDLMIKHGDSDKAHLMAAIVRSTENEAFAWSLRALIKRLRGEQS